MKEKYSCLFTTAVAFYSTLFGVVLTHESTRISMMPIYLMMKSAMLLITMQERTVVYNQICSAWKAIDTNTSI